MVRVHQPPGGETHLNDDLPKEHLNVRVQQPPGGRTHLHEEIAPEQPKVRVLKPPGGGSSISFDDSDDFNVKGKMVPNKEAASPVESAAPIVNDNKEMPKETPKVETNGTSSPPQTPKDNDSSSSTKENSPSNTASTTATTNNTASTNGVVVNGALTNGTSTSGSSTPNSSRLDTQNRLFGQEPQKDTPNRRIRDHHRSNIFNDASASVPVKSANISGGETPQPKTPEDKAPQPPQPQPQQRQRVPPGGFSTKLW